MRNLVFASCLLLTMSALVGAQERPQLAEMAARQALAFYKKGGLTELKINSQDCHKHINDKFFCIYLDTAAQQMDRAVVDQLKMPRDPYFDTEQFLGRAGIILFKSGMDIQDANAFLERSYQQVESALARQAREAEG